MNRKNNYTTTEPIESWGKFLEVIQDLENKGKYKLSLFMTISAYMGLRASETLNLKWKDILERDSVVIYQSKNKKHREIPVHPFVKDSIIRVYRKMGSPSMENYFTRSKKYSGENKPMSVSYINRQFKIINRRYNIGLERFSTHSLRKSMVVRVLSLTTDDSYHRRLCEISKMLGHSSPEQTMKYVGIEQKHLDNLYTMM